MVDVPDRRPRVGKYAQERAALESRVCAAGALPMTVAKVNVAISFDRFPRLVLPVQDLSIVRRSPTTSFARPLARTVVLIVGRSPRSAYALHYAVHLN